MRRNRKVAGLLLVCTAHRGGESRLAAAPRRTSGNTRTRRSWVNQNAERLVSRARNRGGRDSAEEGRQEEGQGAALTSVRRTRLTGAAQPPSSRSLLPAGGAMPGPQPARAAASPKNKGRRPREKWPLSRGCRVGLGRKNNPRIKRNSVRSLSIGRGGAKKGRGGKGDGECLLPRNEGEAGKGADTGQRHPPASRR